MVIALILMASAVGVICAFFSLLVGYGILFAFMSYVVSGIIVFLLILTYYAIRETR